MAERFAAPAVHKSMAVALALIDSDDCLLTYLELSIVKRAKHHDAHTCYRLRAVPGVGKMLALVLRYAIHAIYRFPSVQDCVASCRLVKCAKASAGKRVGTSGQKMGHASLTGAFSEAAAWFLRNHPQAQQYVATLEKKPGKGKAFTIVAHKLARAVYYMLKRATVCDIDLFLQRERAARASLTPHWTRTGSACLARAVRPR